MPVGKSRRTALVLATLARDDLARLEAMYSHLLFSTFQNSPRTLGARDAITKHK
jgi:hypothetical protein